MTKEQFSKLKVGDVVEYNQSGTLTGCQFTVTSLKADYASGTVTKEGRGAVAGSFYLGKEIDGHIIYITLVTQNATQNQEISLSLTQEEAAALVFYVAKMGSAPSCFTTLYSKFRKAFAKDIQDYNGWTSFPNPVSLAKSSEEIKNLQEYLWPVPKKAQPRHKMKGPDGKWAPKNYRTITYPCSKTGELKKRHVLWGEFSKGKEGTNIHVEEWCSDSKKWCPKTYSLAKVGVAENN